MERSFSQGDGLNVYRIMAVAPFGAAVRGFGGVAVVAAGESGGLPAAMLSLAPGVTILMPKEYCPDGCLIFTAVTIEDFDPGNMMQRQPYLAALAKSLGIARSAEKEGLAHCEVEERLRKLLPGVLLDYAPPEREHLKAKPVESAPSASALDDLFSLVDLGGDGKEGAGPEEDRFRGLQMQLETIIRQVMQRIFASPEFRTLESAWRGAALMINAAAEGEGCHRVEFLLVSADEESLPELLEELGSMRASRLPNLILLDYSVSNTPLSLDMLESIIKAADMLMCPFALWVGPEFFGLSQWEELARLSYIRSVLEQAQYARWRTLRKRSGADWTMMMMNRVSSRAVHTGLFCDNVWLSFREKEPHWISPVWVAGALCARSVRETAWPVHTKSPLRFSLEYTPAFATGALTLEVPLPDERARQFADAGFITLSAVKAENRLFLATLSAMTGRPAESQLFFGMVLAFMFRLQENMPEIGYDRSAVTIADMLKLFFSRGGTLPPDDLDVRIEEDYNAGGETLCISFTPPPSIVRADTISFNLRW